MSTVNRLIGQDGLRP